VLACLIIGKAACSYISSLEVRKACENFAARLKEAVFDALLKQDISFHDSRSSGELLSIISSDVRDIKHTLGSVLVSGVKSIITLIGG
jgi:ATP-binding cassette, subfamily B (MDR/TAP), member 8